MPDFAYTARDARGQTVAGKLSAQTEREAITTLANQSLFPVSVKSDDTTSRAAAGKRVKASITGPFYGQLSSLLRSGVPLLRSLAILRDQTSNKSFEVVLTEIHGLIEEGTSVADAMRRYPRVFDEISVNMIKAGAEGGFLEDALERVAYFTEQQEDMKGRTIGALAYPLLIMAAGTIIVGVLLIFFVPMFAERFESLREKGQLPWTTTLLLAVSESIRKYWLFGSIAAAAGVFLLRARLATDEGRFWLDKWRIKAPMIGPIFQSFAVARLCRVLGTLLKNGVPLLKSLEISRDAAGNKVLSRAIAEASDNITAGASLAKPLAASGHFPKTVVEMIAVAEESNTLDKVLVDIADGLEKRTMRQLDLFVRLLEPLMLIVLAGVVLFVVVALLTPMMNMNASV